LQLKGCAITNAVRCVPPQNKPTGPEINACRPYLADTIEAMPQLRVMLALGRIAHDAVLRTVGEKLSAHPFKHGAIHALPRGLSLADSYHTSRYNVNTGVLTPDMFDAVVANMTAVLSTPR
ncbi:MAG: uracil-DNA glycosylase family protein, partial [Pseudomonadota bacterium]